MPAQEPEATDSTERDEPDRTEYADLLLLVDATECHNVDALDEMETPPLLNLYTLLSDVQRTSREYRSLKDDHVLKTLESAVIERKRHNCRCRQN